jgi:hypothetical protein
VVSLAVVVLDVFSNHVPKVTLAERDDVTKALLLDRANEPLGVGIEIRTPCRQAYESDVGRAQRVSNFAVYSGSRSTMR